MRSHGLRQQHCKQKEISDFVFDFTYLIYQGFLSSVENSSSGQFIVMAMFITTVKHREALFLKKKKSTLLNIFCLQYRIMSHQASSRMHSLSALLQNLKDVQRCQCIYLCFRTYPLLNNHGITFSHCLLYSLTL